MATQIISLEVINSPTILQRVIQIVKRRRINIRQFVAVENEPPLHDSVITVTIDADCEQGRLLAAQLKKQIDVIGIKLNQHGQNNNCLFGNDKCNECKGSECTNSKQSSSFEL